MFLNKKGRNVKLYRNLDAWICAHRSASKFHEKVHRSNSLIEKGQSPEKIILFCVENKLKLFTFRVSNKTTQVWRHQMAEKNRICRMRMLFLLAFKIYNLFEQTGTASVSEILNCYANEDA